MCKLCVLYKTEGVLWTGNDTQPDTVATKSKLMPGKGQMTLYLYMPAKLF